MTITHARAKGAIQREPGGGIGNYSAEHGEMDSS